jgi:hypothetical protein
MKMTPPIEVINDVQIQLDNIVPDAPGPAYGYVAAFDPTSNVESVHGDFQGTSNASVLQTKQNEILVPVPITKEIIPTWVHLSGLAIIGFFVFKFYRRK